ncbi:LysR substrate-binding domain-containing protein [Goodfellowiella coeruleoviolacea]|uniref:DNA-binding transcriptional regulator, LysR family n=1 Tax=Goodfellowiella coeruleoviolacea TaxID=334858 RepID=A0AAE3G9S5_9PSEU|nr:LysR substrate-binding domain-containing protein [Goodfellowiella coeruleoviolacea]MCP2164282.1 DNA-binding transcriptional regulator, LysR family [Goodfellowiella coeruleoviolacea]
MFSLTQLTSFVTVAEELHFGRAAERLRMTQPPLSRQIQLLENELRVRLFDRSNRSVKLTHAGRTFLVEARRLLRQAEQAALAAQQASVGEAGSITIGFTAGSTYSALGSLLRTARGALPRVEVVLREMVTMEQFEALSEGILDLGMVRPPITRPDLDSRVLVREPLIAALPVGHPLTEVRPSLSVTHFDRQPLIMYSPVESQYFYNLLISVFRGAGVTPVFTQYLSQIHSVLALVNDGWGVSLVPAAAAQLQYQGVTFHPVDLPEANPVELDLAWRRSNDNPALAALLRAL